MSALLEAADTGPFDPVAVLAAAHQLWTGGDRDGALAALRNIGRIRPGDPKVANAVSSAYLTAGQAERASNAARRLIAWDPSSSLAYRLFLSHPGRTSDVSQRAARKLLTLATSDWGDWLAAGLVLGKAGQARDASYALARANALSPSDDTRRPLAKALLDAGRTREAVKILADLEQMDAGTFDLLLTHGTSIGAFATVERAIARHGPSLPDSHARIALAEAHIHRYRGLPNEEKRAIDIATRDPRLADRMPIEHLTWAVRSGTDADIAAVFDGTVYGRLASTAPPTPASATDLHTADPFDGYNISVDLAFASWLARFRDRFSHPRLWVGRRSRALFARSFPEFDVRPYDNEVKSLALGAGDLHFRELPLVLSDKETGDVGEASAFLTPDPEMVDAVRRRNRRAADARPIVGLCWRSSALSQNDPEAAGPAVDKTAMPLESYLTEGLRFWRKCVALPFFSALITDPDIRVTSMQYGLEPWEAEALGAHPDYGALEVPDIDHFGDLDHAVAQIAALDALVTIPCGYAHIAAALGVPTYVLLNDVPVIYWVWQQRANLYPRVSLFTKEATWRDGDMITRKYAGDWRPTVDAAHQALRQALFGRTAK